MFHTFVHRQHHISIFSIIQVSLMSYTMQLVRKLVEHKKCGNSSDTQKLIHLEIFLGIDVEVSRRLTKNLYVKALYLW